MSKRIDNWQNVIHIHDYDEMNFALVKKTRLNFMHILISRSQFINLITVH